MKYIKGIWLLFLTHLLNSSGNLYLRTMFIKNKYFRFPSVEAVTEKLCKSIFSVFLLLLIVANITACRSTYHFDYDVGQALSQRTDILETTLHLGESGMDDVLQVLGKPGGKGKFMLPFDPAGRTTWSYFYEKGVIKIKEGLKTFHFSGNSKRTFLFIYFDDNDKYDGYMWFAGDVRIRGY